MNHPRDDYDRIAETWLTIFVAVCTLAPVAFRMGWMP